MHHIQVVLFCIAYYCSSVYAFPLDDEPKAGYYWREFNGTIPYDALPGGLNPKGTVTYIGQVFNERLVVPAKIDVDNSTVSYEWGYKEHLAHENIKILCAKHPEQFQWLSSANGLIPHLKEKHLIVGGYEKGANIYIGRIQLDDELSLGKIINGPNQTTLNTTKDGKGFQHPAFQILSYNPKIKPKTTSCD